jgi:hypothetical protein
VKTNKNRIAEKEREASDLSAQINKYRAIGRDFDELAERLAIIRSDLIIIKSDPFYYNNIRGRSKIACIGGKV